MSPALVGGFFIAEPPGKPSSLYVYSCQNQEQYAASLAAQRLKHLPAMQETWVRSLGWEDPLEKEMATHSSILVWRIPWTEEPGGLQSTGLQSRTQLSNFTSLKNNIISLDRSLCIFSNSSCFPSSLPLPKTLLIHFGVIDAAFCKHNFFF